jgi:hypothetical protein
MDPNLFIVFLATVTVTSYQPLPQQTRQGCNGIHDCFTAVGDIPTKSGVAVSQDFLRSGQVHYGDVLDIEGIGLKVVNDCMNKRHKKSIDIMVWSYEEEHRIGVQHRKVWVIHTKGTQQCNGKHTPIKNQCQTVGHVKVNEILPSDTTVHSDQR